MLTLILKNLVAFVHAMPPQRAHCPLRWSCVPRVTSSTPQPVQARAVLAAAQRLATCRRRPRSDNGRLQQPAEVGGAHTVLRLGRDRR